MVRVYSISATLLPLCELRLAIYRLADIVIHLFMLCESVAEGESRICRRINSL